MTLHVFNPEHDLALASGLSNFTAPHAGRQLHYDLAWLPALWAEQDDVILVENVEKARRAVSRRKARPCLLADKHQLAALPVDRIDPWGWDKALRASLLRMGIREELMPTDEALDQMRQLSHRRTAAMLLPQLQDEGTTGTACECTSTEHVRQLAAHYGRIVLKAPWSSSGRGIRFLDHQLPNVDNWLRNIIARQGSVMVEPYYRRVKDFGMEFMSDGQGTVTCLGLSLFHTANGAYTGNILATEQAKREMLGRYIPLSLLDATQQRICHLLGEVFKDKYQGPFGIDMMVVTPPDIPEGEELSPLPGGRAGCLLHPCVEINLRRTMGHVALAAHHVCNPTNDDDLRYVMRIDYTNNNYKLHITRQ